MAVIDSGVAASHPHVGAIGESVCIEPSGGDAIDRIGHGTAVAAAIRDLAPGATLIVGKIFHRSLSTNADVLARGIAWAISRRARVINLSLGTPNRAHEETLKECVAQAAAAGALVVSAREGGGVVWLPGSLPGVVSVVADPRLDREELVVDDAGFTAAPFPRPIRDVPKERNLRGVSFAVANVSGFLARLLESRPDLRRVEDVLRDLST